MTIRQNITLVALGAIAILYALAATTGEQTGAQAEPEQVSKRIPALVKISDNGVPCSELKLYVPTECKALRGSARVVDGVKYAHNGVPCSELKLYVPMECKSLRGSARVVRDIVPEMNPLDDALEIAPEMGPFDDAVGIDLGRDKPGHSRLTGRKADRQRDFDRNW
ncbi:hypothetical protein [Erythrobacter aureus]|uniref:DUF2282 domain-containing protein n=1 Tax=Erythrobacter aureus TaxID=2182384 RepID=A0A345YIR9_9SPHN|nr:hypothetical protein [Erythrobacter aureus]AXK43821.1 hypothetical protein DVR09_15305 [Erythrobacter aureus]